MKTRFNRHKLRGMKSLFNVKRFNKVFIIWFSFFCIVVFVQLNSCKKDSNNADPQKIVPVHYIDPQADREYYFYGKDPFISSAIIKKQSSSDTLLCLLYDEQIRVKSMYIIINGNVEESLLDFDYEDSIIVICKYSVDWQSGESNLANLMTVSKKQLSDIIPGIMQDFPMGSKNKNGQEDHFCDKISSWVVTATVLGLVGVWIGGTACLPCAIVAGLGVGIICIPPGNAAETPVIYPPNPVIQFNKTFPVNNTNELVNYEWMINCDLGGGETLEFKDNGITLNPLNNFKGTYTLQGRNINFTYAFCCTCMYTPGTNYYIGTVSADGKHINGTLYNLFYHGYPYAWDTFWADGF